MLDKTCQIVLVGHSPEKLILSIDKEIFDKLIFITEKEKQSGSKKALEALETLITTYRLRKTDVDHRTFSFKVETKPVAELTHLVYQQRLNGFKNVIVNISGGLRTINIWLYLACSITNTRVIHGDFVYDGGVEVGINKNDILKTISLGKLTSKQFEFLKIFFSFYKDPLRFFNNKYNFDDNPLLSKRIKYESIEQLRTALNKLRSGEEITRGAINGFINKLNRIAALDIMNERQNKKEVSISFIGISFFLEKLINLDGLIKEN